MDQRKAAKKTDEQMEDLQTQIDNITTVVLEMHRVDTAEETDQIDDAMMEEEARQASVAWDIILDYLSRQWLPEPVKHAYEHLRRSQEYDG